MISILSSYVYYMHTPTYYLPNHAMTCPTIAQFIISIGSKRNLHSIQRMLNLRQSFRMVISIGIYLHLRSLSGRHVYMLHACRFTGKVYIVVVVS